MVEEPKLPLEPEAPQLVVWARWLLHYARYEGAVIRQAPVAFCLGILVVGALIFFGLEWHNSGVERTKDATIQNQQSHIATLEEELKGAAPQLAALQARRAAIRSKLLEFYVAAGPLMKIDGPEPDLPNKQFSPGVVDNFVQQHLRLVDLWEKQTSEWIGDNLGPAAQARFLDISNMPSFVWSFKNLGVNGDLTIQMNRLSNERKNLASLIETAAYDK